MSSIGPLSPGTMADDATVGTLAWGTVDNAKVSDGSYTRIAGGSGGDFSHYLKATNFGFSIPSGVTITGIVVEIERKVETNATAQDINVKIVKADGTIGTTNKSTGASWSSTESYISFGGSSDLWGETWDDTKINDVDFGVVLSAYTDGLAGAGAVVDHIRITVYYTDGTSRPTATGRLTATRQVATGRLSAGTRRSV